MKGCSRKSSDKNAARMRVFQLATLNERLLPKEQRLLLLVFLSVPLFPLNERLLPKEQRRLRLHIPANLAIHPQ